MRITVVTFRAFDRQAVEAFIDHAPKQVHEKLDRLCNTYEPCSITIIDVVPGSGDPMPLQMLNQFKK